MCPSSPLVEHSNIENDREFRLLSATAKHGGHGPVHGGHQGHPDFNHDFNHGINNKQSLAIPLPDSHIHRTESELQLCEDMAVAEYRDRCMFNRLISGIRQRQQLHYNVQRHQYRERISQTNNSNGHGSNNGSGNPSQSRSCQSSSYSNNQSQTHFKFQNRKSAAAMSNSNAPAPATNSDYMQETERSIENIISTRCQPASAGMSTNMNLSLSMSVSSVPSSAAPGIDIDSSSSPTSSESACSSGVAVNASVNVNVCNSNCPTQPHYHRVNRQVSRDADDDWAIEGFDDSPASPGGRPPYWTTTSTIVIQEGSEHDDHVFDIEL